jgi:hypothetical protein
MGLLDGIEKLINEHGSATILKERIALANDKYIALERRLTECDAAKIKLTADNEALRFSLEKATIEIQNLKKISEPSHDSRFDEVRERVLVTVAKSDGATEQQIAKISGASDLIVKYHLEELRKTKLVGVQHTMGSDWEGTGGTSNWSVLQPGLVYLVRHGLVT